MNSVMQTPVLFTGPTEPPCCLGFFMPRFSLKAMLQQAFSSLGLVFAIISGAAMAQDKPAAKVAKPDVTAGQQIAAGVCAGCHGADGNSQIPTNPKLAAQHAAYLGKQLHNFKPRADGKPPERNNAIMQGFAAALDEQQIRDVAAYYAAQKLKPSAAKDQSLVELGQKIYRGGIADKAVPACAGCHSPNGAGIPDQYPRLQGQYAEYTESQLVAFRAGTRANSGQMMTISARLSDKEMKAVADYIAGMR